MFGFDFVICCIRSVSLIVVSVVELVASLLLLLVIVYLIVPLAVEGIDFVTLIVVSVLSADHCFVEEIVYFLVIAHFVL